MKGKKKQILQENIRKYLCDLELHKVLLNRILKLLIAGKSDTLDHVKINNFFLIKMFINRVKKQTTKCG